MAGTPGTSRPAETVVELGAEEPVLGPGRVEASATAAPGVGGRVGGGGRGWRDERSKALDSFR